MAFNGAYVCLIHALARTQTAHNKSVVYSGFLPAGRGLLSYVAGSTAL